MRTRVYNRYRSQLKEQANRPISIAAFLSSFPLSRSELEKHEKSLSSPTNKKEMKNFITQISDEMNHALNEGNEMKALLFFTLVSQSIQLNSLLPTSNALEALLMLPPEKDRRMTQEIDPLRRRLFANAQ